MLLPLVDYGQQMQFDRLKRRRFIALLGVAVFCAGAASRES
jgi:hypothetical protein